MRESGRAVRVVVLEAEQDDYQDVFVRLHAEVGVVEIYTTDENGEEGELVATAPLGHTLIKWGDDSAAKYPASDREMVG